jgi:hypothetical protein
MGTLEYPETTPSTPPKLSKLATFLQPYAQKDEEPEESDAEFGCSSADSLKDDGAKLDQTDVKMDKQDLGDLELARCCSPVPPGMGIQKKRAQLSQASKGGKKGGGKGGKSKGKGKGSKSKPTKKSKQTKKGGKSKGTGSKGSKGSRCKTDGEQLHKIGDGGTGVDEKGLAMYPNAVKSRAYTAAKRDALKAGLTMEKAVGVARLAYRSAAA